MASRSYPGPLTYNVTGDTFQTILENDRQSIYGHTDGLQTQDELLGGVIKSGGKGQVGYAEITANASTHVLTVPSGFAYMVSGIVYQLSTNVEQGFLDNTLNYVFLDEDGSVRVSDSSNEGSSEVLVATVDDTGGTADVDMWCTGKQWVAPCDILERFVETTSNWVSTGLIVQPSASLNTTISAGVAYVSGWRIVKSEANLTFMASKDTYVDLGISGYTLTAVDIGQPEPSLAANNIRLAKVTTDSSQITSITDLRSKGPISLGNAGSDGVAGQLNAYLVTTTTPATPDQEFSVTHALGKTPTGYILVNNDAACSVYSSNVSNWNATTAYFKCNTASVNITLLLF